MRMSCLEWPSHKHIARLCNVALHVPECSTRTPIEHEYEHWVSDYTHAYMYTFMDKQAPAYMHACLHACAHTQAYGAAHGTDAIGMSAVLSVHAPSGSKSSEGLTERSPTTRNSASVTRQAACVTRPAARTCVRHALIITQHSCVARLSQFFQPNQGGMASRHAHHGRRNSWHLQEG